MNNERPIRIYVHPTLAEELKIRKEILEKKLAEKGNGYSLNGGMPIVSKIAALELKKKRKGVKKNINIAIQKVKGVKKNEITAIW